jgi:putative tryptophan/tyrosine transport system substrate-binding protein
MRRREFVTLLGAMAWPLDARAQPPGNNPRRVGILLPQRPNEPFGQTRAMIMVQSLGALDWREGSNLRIDWRWAGGDTELFERYAAELVTLGPDVLWASTTPAVAALRRQTASIPIVFVTLTDPVGQGFVASLARPGGNMTGFTDFDPPMAAKWLEMLTQIIPPVAQVAVLFNPATAPFAHLMLHAIEEVAPSFAMAVRASPCRDDAEIEAMMMGLARENRAGLIILSDYFTFAHRSVIIASAAQARLPTVYWSRTFVEGGGLMSYGVDNNDMLRRSATYVDRILKGTDPSDLPIQNPSKFTLVINLKTANALGLSIAATLLAAADEVIE